MFRKFAFNIKSTIRGSIRTLVIRNLALTIIAGLSSGLNILFIRRVLGADAIALSILTSVWSIVFLTFIFIGGWISQYSRKKMMVAGMTLTLFNPLIYAFAPDWRMIIIAYFLGALGSTLVTPAYVSLLFSFSERKNRSRTIAIMNTLNSLANSIVPPIGATLIQTIGKGDLNWLRNIFIAQFFLTIAVVIYTWRRLEDKPLTKRRPMKKPTEAVKDIFGQIGKVYKVSKKRGATPWLLLSLTGPWAWETIGPFWVIYAAEICSSPVIVLGFLPSLYSLIVAILALPLAEISDKKGRKKAILMTRPFLHLCIISLLIGGTIRNWAFTPFIPLIAWILRAIGNSSGPSWTAASTEVIPEEMQSEWEATRTFLWRSMTIPAVMVGGFLWEIDPRLPFLTALLVDGLIRFPILIRRIPETLIVSNRRPRPAGPHIILYGLPGAGKTFIARLIQRDLSLELIDESFFKADEKRAIPIPFLNNHEGEKKIEEKVDSILTNKDKAVIIEGEPAIFAAKNGDKGLIILLVAPKGERLKRELGKNGGPDFLAFKRMEEKDRKVVKLVRRLFDADVSKLPPFDIAINTERVPPEKIVEIIALLHGEKDEGRVGEAKSKIEKVEILS